MRTSKNCLLWLTLAVMFVVTVNVRADVINFSFVSMNGNSPKSAADGLFDALSLTAANDPNGNGVTFTFFSTYTGGNPDEAGGAGKIFGNEFFLYNTGGLFDGGDDITTCGGISGAGNVWRNADFTAETSGYALIDNVWQTSFTLNYIDGMDWEDFVTWITEENPFTVATHLQALYDGESAKILGTWVPETNSSPTPEPATLAVLGLGLAGLGLARRWRK